MLAEADARSADLLLTPELFLSGYPPEDLLLREDFISHCQQIVDQFQPPGQCALLLGHPLAEEGRLYNAASLLGRNEDKQLVKKQELPNYRVFDEKRYFTAGQSSQIIHVKGHKLGVLICEDMWVPGPAEVCARLGAELLLVLNASPFHEHKYEQRLQQAQGRVSETGLPLIYCNMVGGQDELVFDGASFALDANGDLVYQAADFAESLDFIEFSAARMSSDVCLPVAPAINRVRRAIVIGIRDYVHKSGFSRVCLGLSGGIDSALVLALAVEALGAEAVQAVMMPSPYTSGLSLDLAREQAEKLAVNYSVVDIRQPFESLLAALETEFSGLPADVTEENLQSRIRGTLLMAISNKKGALLLATGNKSEFATGYATLYGDMNGAYAPIKDCFKTRVYELAEEMNREDELIPRAVIERPPSAELAPDQVDSDSLPEYPVLDAILQKVVEEDASSQSLLEQGFRKADIERALTLLYRNEYKRRQSAPGPRISERAFGKDRRYPVCSSWKGLP